MLEDKLNQDQRLRLECLAQANSGAWGMSAPRQAQDVVKRAKVFEDFVRSGGFLEATEPVKPAMGLGC